MKTDMKHHIYILALLTALTSCADTLFDDSAEGRTDNDGIQFCVSTQEQNELTIALGQNHEADHYKAHAMTGDHTYGLKAVSMPLPLMGIHKGTVSAQSAQSAPTTRAAYTDIVATNGSNFHDSLTIWGYTYQPYKTGGTDADKCTIFNQILLKRITNWRSAAHWPYGGGSMKFYALAPSMENVNVQAAGGSFDTPPTLTYQLPDYTLPTATREMYDLLWGESEVTDIEALDKEANIGQDNKLVSLRFQHILTAIRFAQGNIPEGITIKQISLHNVNTKATFNPAAIDPATGTRGAWSGLSNTGSYTLYPNFEVTTANTYISDSVFFMIPHTVTSGAELQVVIEAKPKYVYTETSREPAITETPARQHTLKCSLEGDVWKKGYTVTYKLTIGEVEDGYYMLAESPSAAPHSTSATNGTFPVHSYHSYWDYDSNTENTTHAVNWQIVGYSNTEPTETTTFTDSKPDWLTISGANSGTTGEFVGGNGAVANYTISGQSYISPMKHSTILKANSTASNINLSTHYPDGTAFTTAETANSYIINRPGSNYQFPTVYGNGKTDGGSSFVDHTGSTITHSSIKEQIEAKNSGFTYEITNGKEETDPDALATKAEYSVSGSNVQAAIVWQDSEGLINSVGYASDKISFNVPSSEGKPIRPGNAVIALQGRKVYKHYKRNSENTNWELTSDADTHGEWETFWTWHIWVTDEVYKNDGTDNSTSKKYDEQFLNSTTGDHIVSITNNSSTPSTILPVNLGWVPDEDEFGYYAHREVWVKLQQTEPTSGTPATTVVKIEQHARQPLITGTSTVYQWGRPTALPAVCYANKNPRTIYMGSEFSSHTFTLENISAPQDIITNPTKLFRTSGSGESWFDTSSVPGYWGSSKTVYDPCPPGFRLPAYTIFTGFSLTGETAADGTKLNMWQDAGAHGKGAYFYTNPNAVVVTGNTSEASYSAANGHDRYEQTVYMPATGQYQGNKAAGTPMNTSSGDNSIFIDANAGVVWTYGNANKKGQCLWFYPDWNHSDSGKPAIALPRSGYFSTAMPIRPTGNLPAY